MIKLNHVFVLALFAVCSKTCYAQGYIWNTEGRSRTAIGMVAGLNVADIIGVTPGIRFKRLGVYAGAFLHWNFKPRWAFRPGITYNQLGSADNANPKAGDFSSYTIALDYITMPFQFIYYLDSARNWGLEFGPAISFLIRERLSKNDILLAKESNYYFVGVSLHLGINYFLNRNWGFFVRYSNSVFPIAPTGKPAAIGGQSIQLHTTFTLGLHYTFRKKYVGQEIKID